MTKDNTQEDQKQQQEVEKQGGFTISSQDLDLTQTQEVPRIDGQAASLQQQALKETPVLPPWPETPAICLPIGLGHALFGSLAGLLFGSITKVTSVLSIHVRVCARLACSIYMFDDASGVERVQSVYRYNAFFL